MTKPLLTAACMEKYTETKNANAFGGVKKPHTTKTACQAACTATTKGNPNYCYGFDFDQANSGCWFQEKNYTLNTPAVGVNNYRRSTVCPTTVVTVGGEYLLTSHLSPHTPHF